MADMMRSDIERAERLRAVTDNLFFWQGLRFVPFGPFLILAALASSYSGAFRWLVTAMIVAAMLGATYASTMFATRYRREFGSVRPIPGAHATRSALKWFLIYPVMFASLALDLFWRSPILISGVVWGGAVLLYRHSTGAGREHYFVLAAAIGILSLAPAAIGVTSKEAVTLLFLVLGAGYTICGLLDDRQMRRIVKPA